VDSVVVFVRSDLGVARDGCRDAGVRGRQHLWEIPNAAAIMR
jgi:hypothetical protein